MIYSISSHLPKTFAQYCMYTLPPKPTHTHTHTHTPPSIDGCTHTHTHTHTHARIHTHTLPPSVFAFTDLYPAWVKLNSKYTYINKTNNHTHHHTTHTPHKHNTH